MEEKQKKEREREEKRKMQEEAAKIHTIRQDDEIQASNSKTSFPEDDEDDWNPFDIELPIFEKSKEELEVPTQIDILDQAHSQEIETQIDEISKFPTADPTQDSQHLMDIQQNEDTKNDDVEDIFGEDSEDETPSSEEIQSSAVATKREETQEEVETFPQEPEA